MAKRDARAEGDSKKPLPSLTLMKLNKHPLSLTTGATHSPMNCAHSKSVQPTAPPSYQYDSFNTICLVWCEQTAVAELLAKRDARAEGDFKKAASSEEALSKELVMTTLCATFTMFCVVLCCCRIHRNRRRWQSYWPSATRARRATSRRMKSNMHHAPAHSQSMVRRSSPPKGIWFST